MPDTLAPRPSLIEALEARTLLSTALTTIKWGQQRLPTEPGQWLLRMHAAKGTPARQVRTLDAALRDFDPRLHVQQHLGRRGLVLVRSPRHLPYKKIVNVARQLRGFIRVEPNFLISAAETIPPDPRFDEQYALRNTGQNDGTPGADINATSAWDITTGVSTTLVGVLDSGVDYNHPDLNSAIWTNPGEIPGDDLDNDNNGYIDDIRGWDFVNNDADPMDDDGHGTHVTGVLAASFNSIGISGVAPGVRVLPLKMLDDDGDGNIADAVAAINYATLMRSRGHNLRVTNNSWGEYDFSQLLYEAIEQHQAAGILFIAAAGNNSRDIDSDPYTPAAFDLPGVISVVATDRNDLLASFSNFGAASTDIAAPGAEILSTIPGGDYAALSGTSMAAPYVSGIAALAFSISPPGVSYTVIRDAILSSGDELPSLSGKTTTGRRADAFNTLMALPLIVLQSTPAPAATLAAPPSEFTLHFSHPLDASTLAPADLTVNGTPADSVTLLDSRTARFDFVSSPVLTQGPQQINIAEGAIARIADGAAMSVWSSTFWYDTVPLQLTSSSPSSGAVVAPGPITLDLQFSDDVAAASLDASDLVLTHGIVASAELLNSNTIRFTLAGLDSEATVAWSLPAGAITDLFANGSLPASGSFVLDHTSQPIPVPLISITPLLSRAHASSAVTGIIHAPSDLDQFTLSLDPHQTLSLEALGHDGLSPALSIGNPEGELLATTSADDSRALLQHIPAATAGVYTISIASAAGTTGAYTLRLWLNALTESENRGGPSNDTLATAQPLPHAGLLNILGRTEHPPGVLPEESEPNDTLAQSNSATSNFTAAAPGLHHLLIDGDIPNIFDLDTYSLGTLFPGDVLTISLAGSGSPRGTLYDPYLQLYRGDPGSAILVDEDDDNGAGRDALLRLPIWVEDTYYLRASPYPGTREPDRIGNYDLSIFLQTPRTLDPGPGVGAEVEPNPTFSTATDIATVWRPVQYHSTTTGVISTTDRDYLAYTFNAGDLITLSIDGDDDADPALRLRDSDGNVLAYDDGLDANDLSAAGIVAFSIPATGTYYLEVFAPPTASPAMAGQYTAHLYLSTTTPPPQPPTIVGDLYSLQLAAGEFLGAALAFEGAGSQLHLLDATGNLLASGSTTTGDLTLALASFPIADIGLYHLQITGPATRDYTLTVVRDATLDLEPNDATATAQDLTPASAAVGYLAPGDEDWYSFTASAGDLLYFNITIPASGPGEFDNILNPILELYAPDGSLISSTPGPLLFTSPADGQYRLRLRAPDTTGAYSLNLANFTTGLRGTSADDSFHLRLDPTAQNLELTLNTTAYTLPLASLPELKLLGLAGNDQLIIDSVHGNPLATTSLSLTGDFTLHLLPSANNVLPLPTLSIADDSTLDLLDNDLILHAANPASILWLITSARLISSSATFLTTLAATVNTRGNNTPLLTTFSGQPVTPSDVLVKFTYKGDANFDGRVTIADYLITDRASARSLTGWINGDFDHSGGPPDATDYFLLDQSFLAGGPTL